MGTVSGGGTYWKGQPFTLTAIPKSGYKFKGWSGGSSSTSTTLNVSNVYSNASYTATFEANNTMTVTSSLPTKVGDVSIMPLYILCSLCKTDPTNDYNTSTYYVYGICDSTGSTGPATGSTSANLQVIGLQWYKQLNKPTERYQTWMQAGHEVFGGPLDEVIDWGGSYGLSWWYCTSDSSYSSLGGHYWNNGMDTSVYIAVVRAR